MEHTINNNELHNFDTELSTALHKNSELEFKLKVDRVKYKLVYDDLNCGIWEYNIQSKKLIQDRKLDGKWCDTNLTIDNYRETIKGWGIIHPEDIQTFDDYCDSLDNGDEHFVYDIRAIGDKSCFIWLRYIGETVLDESGKAAVVIGKTIDVSKEKNETSEKYKNPRVDPLTQLYTKAYAKKMIDDILADTAGSNVCHMMLIIDVDNFKAINDTWGRLYGDYVLEAVAARLTGTLSSTDVIGYLGKDEYVVFCTEISNPEKDVAKICNRLMRRIKGIFLKNETHLSVSIGAALSPKHGENYESLYRSADIALYHAKRSVKGSFAVYSRFVTYNTSVGETSLKNKGEANVIKQHINIEKKLIDYAFDIIYQEDDISHSLNTIFTELGKYFGFERISFVEFNKTANTAGILGIWNRNQEKFNDTSYIQLFKGYFNELVMYYRSGALFYEYHSSNCCDTEHEHLDRIFRGFGVRSLIQFPVIHGNDIVGTINFENYDNDYNHNENEFSAISGVAKIIAFSYLKMRNRKVLENDSVYSVNAMELQRPAYYVIDSDTYLIKHISRYAPELFPNIKVGEKCYKSVFGLSSPCSTCPARGLNEERSEYSLETYSEKYSLWFSASASRVKKGGDSKENLICWTDVSAFAENTKAKDRLTGTLSYEKFKAVILKKLAESFDTHYVAVISIRDFSDINDEFGYKAGDKVIKMAAKCYENILIDDELLCRIKGDDCILLLNDTSSDKQSAVLDVRDRLKNASIALEIMMREEYPSMNIRCLGGVYRIKSDDYSINDIIDKACLARNKAGEFSTSETHVFGEYDHDAANLMLDEQEIERTMEAALKEKQFQVYLQPKVDMRTEKIGGAEALVRWITPEGKIIPNSKFIPLFEKNGFIIKLDQFVYNETLRLIRKWLDEGKEVPLVSMNVSRLHLFDETFPDYLVGLTEKYGVPQKFVEIEITESVFFDNTDRLIDMISRLQKSGFVISMDDFGTGYSTLSLMKSLPIDIIKIDGSFFLNSELDEKSKAIISAIIHLSKKLNLKIVSEGIETAEQVEFIKAEKCDYAQGYHYFRPIPHYEFEKLI